MELKELLRVCVTGEMQDVSVFRVEAEAFGSRPKHGPAISALFFRLAEEKLERLKTLHLITKGSIGFRQRRTEPARSVEAALRVHISNAQRSVVNYTALEKELIKPEFKQAVTEMALAEIRITNELLALQALIKKAP